MEDKTAFVNAVQEALIIHGGGRYDYLMEHPLIVDEYEIAGKNVDGYILKWGNTVMDITGDSLLAILKDMYRLIA